MKSGFSADHEKPQPKGESNEWTELGTSEAIKLQLVQLASDAIRRYNSTNRQETVKRLEGMYEDVGYPYPVSVSISENAELRISTLSALDGSRIDYPK